MSDLWIGFDADDTLWHNESFYVDSYELFADVVAGYFADRPDPRTAAHDYLIEIERINIAAFGYGFKGATISMIEAAIVASNGTIGTSELMRLIDRAKSMMTHPVELIDGAIDVLDAVSQHRLAMLTKGDLLDQHRKIDASQIAERFDAIEVLHDKTVDTYRTALARHRIDPTRFVMVGNSIRSDVLPVLDLGGWAIHVPYTTTWALEHAEVPDSHPRFRAASSLDEVASIIEECCHVH